MPSAPKWVFDAFDGLMPKTPPLTVVETTYLSPSVKRLGLAGDLSPYAFQVGTFFDFRVNDTDVRRYTVAAVTADKKRIELLAHLHGNGPGSKYMDRMAVGDTITLNKPRSDQRYDDPKAQQLVIFGDESSLGLASSFLPALGERQHLFLLELDEENMAIPPALGLASSSIHQKTGLFTDAAWLSALPVLNDPAWQHATFVLTGNVRSVQAFRKVIKAKTEGKVNAHGYWLQGRKGL